LIISQDLQLIFLKTKKVGGTSFEMALSKYCGDVDVITPITPNDEAQRKSLGFRTAQHFENPVWFKMQNGKRVPFGRADGTFYNHISASEAAKMIPAEIWDGYLKVSMVRSPYDVMISRYFWEGGEKTGIEYGDFVARFTKLLLENKAITHIRHTSPVDFFIRYEHLDEDIKALQKKLNITGLLDTFKSLKAKGNLRPKTGTSIQEMYKKYPDAKKIIDKICAEEIEKFGYDFEIS